MGLARVVPRLGMIVINLSYLILREGNDFSRPCICNLTINEYDWAGQDRDI